MGQSDAALGGRLPLLDPKALEGDQEQLYQLMTSTLVVHGHVIPTCIRRPPLVALAGPSSALPWADLLKPQEGHT
jgi:hypothetical protein